MTVTTKYISKWDSSKDKGPRGFPGAAGGISVPDAEDILTNLLTVDGTGSDLDADKLDGQHGAYYAPVASPTFTGTVTAADVTMSGVLRLDNYKYIGLDKADGTQDFWQIFCDNGTGAYAGASGFSIFGGTTPGARMSITAAGLGGVNTAAPQAYWDINGTHENQLRLRATTGNSAAILFAENNANKWQLYHRGADGNFYLYSHTLMASLMTWGVNGNVAIPSGGLHVGGTADAGDNNILADGEIRCVGNIIAAYVP